MEMATTHGWTRDARASQAISCGNTTGEARLREDEVSFPSFVERHQRFVYKVAWALLRNRDDADDLTQECFLRLYRKRAWHGLDNERAYLARVVWRMARDRQRQPAREEGGMELDTVTATDRAPEAATIAAGALDRIHRMIDTLPEELRRPLVLAAVEEMTSAEIGIALGIPEGTVRTRIQRARALLKQKLGPGFDPHTEVRHDR